MSPLIFAPYRIERVPSLRVPDVVLRSIGFVSEVLGTDMSSDSLDPVGTCFLVNLSGERSRSIFFSYAITAKHIFDKGTPNTETVVIVNKKGGGVQILQTYGPWVFHEDRNVDIAVRVVTQNPGAELSAFGAQDFFDESRDAEIIGVGDQVFFPGLFTAAPGRERIIPLVRHGNLAMLPGQELQTPDGYADIYLVEGRSIGGISGSPVFVRETLAFPVTTQHSQGRDYRLLGPGPFKLLGLMQGHWDVNESKINQAFIQHEPKRGVNLGIAKVIPARKIMEVLNRPELKNDRAEAEAAWIRARSGSLD